MNCRIGLYIDGPNPSASDYNIWYNNDRFGIIQDGQQFQNLSDWQSYSGKDKNSFSENPMFADPLNADFTLKTGSPAIDKGEKLDTMYANGLHPQSKWPHSVDHLDQNQYGDGWEIGAYVYTGVNTGTCHQNYNYLKIYPNPATDWITIDDNQTRKKHHSFEIINSYGHRMLVDNQHLPNKICISQLPAGQYFINSEKETIGKFIKYE